MVFQDDLAATANYDAVFFEDPSAEMMDYYSDWDELSDDYYDDDPTVERRQRVAKLAESSKTASHDAPQKTQRRRRNDNKAKQSGDASGRTSATSTSSKTPDLATFQSVVWKLPDYDKNPVQVLHPDDGEKVALLKNWREVFKNSHPSIGRSNLRKQGVLNFLNSKMEPAALPPGSLPEDEIKREVSTDWTSGDSSLENVRETDNGSGDLSNTSPEKSLSPPAAAQGGNKIANPPLKNNLAVKSKGNPSLYPQIVPNSTEAKSSGSGGGQPTSSPARGRKRKASIVDEKNTNSSVQGEIKGPRSKRAATKKVGQDSQPALAPASGPVRRSTRQTGSQK